MKTFLNNGVVSSRWTCVWAFVCRSPRALVLFMLLFLGTLGGPVLAEMPQERIKAAKVAYLTRELGLSPEEAEKFWPLYNQFEAKRGALKERMRDLMEEGQRTSFSNDDKADKALDEMLDIREEELQLERNFRKSMNGILPARRLVVLHQAEREFQKELLRRLRDHQGDGPGRHPGGGGGPRRPMRGR